MQKVIGLCGNASIADTSIISLLHQRREADTVNLEESKVESHLVVDNYNIEYNPLLTTTNDVRERKESLATLTKEAALLLFLLCQKQKARI
jgi:hypothetical protein